MAAEEKGERFLLQDWDGNASLAQTTFSVHLPDLPCLLNMADWL